MPIESSNLMARNFVSHAADESKYSKAREAAAEARGQMNNRQNGILLAGMAACAAEDTLSRRILEGKKAARRMGLDMQQNVSEKNREALDRLKKEREERARPEEETPEAEGAPREESAGAQAPPEKNGTEAATAAVESPAPDRPQQIVTGDVDLTV